MSNSNFKVDFIGVGVPRAATSWIFRCLEEHPQVCVSSQKETEFFLHDEVHNQGLEFYKSYFNHCRGEKIRGEYNPDYMRDKKAASRIKNLFPDVKLIACLRNPIERAYSVYFFRLTKGLILAGETFEEFLEQKHLQVETGFYYPQLKRFLELFPRENILILIYEDIQKNPTKFIQNVYGFLEVDSGFIPHRANRRIGFAAEDKRHISWFHGADLENKKKSLEQKGWGRIIVKTLELTGLIYLIRFLLGKNLKTDAEIKKPLAKPPINPETRKRLREIYQEDIKNLEKLINRDLGHWK